MTQTTYSRASALESRIQSTLTNTFIALGGMWAVTAVTSYLTLNVQMTLTMMLVLFGGSLLTLFATMAFRNSGFGLVLLAVFAGLEGASLGPLMNHYLHLHNGVQMVTTAAVLTMAATFGCALFCVTTRKSFSQFGGFLFAGLIILLVASIAGIFFHSQTFDLVVSGAASLLFVGYMLYDISAVVNGEETNYISAALGVYLDMLNLFLNLLRLLEIFNSSDD